MQCQIKRARNRRWDRGREEEKEREENDREEEKREKREKRKGKCYVIEMPVKVSEEPSLELWRRGRGGGG